AQSFFYVDSVTVDYRRLHRAHDGRLSGVLGAGVVSVTGFDTADLAGFDLTDPDRPSRWADATIDSGADGFRYTTTGGSAVAAALVQDLGTAATPRVEPDVASSLRDTANAAAYIVVTPDALVDAARRLADRRGADFGSSLVVRLQDVMDEFADGRYHPPAIRDFLTYATSRWATPPTHVALLGDGSFDYQDRGGLGGNLLPPTLTGTPFGLYSSDLGYGDLDGDLRFDLALGRIPAATLAEAHAYVDKVEAYEAANGAWRQNVLLLADNDDKGGPFSAEIAEVASLLPPALNVEVGYLGVDGTSALRQRLFDAAARGVGWVDWMGHGGVDRLADEGVLTNADVPALDTEGRWPIFALLSCNVARHELPGFVSLAEDLVLADGGAIAVLAPSGLALDIDSFDANRLLVDEAWSGEHETLGQVFQAMMRRYADLARLDSDVAVYQLMGDPGLLLDVPDLAAVTIFANGFEEGDLNAWDGARP
ncbi:MAG: C25 family cysteine peptidase, partial [Acidobacteriota bacterium]